MICFVETYTELGFLPPDSYCVSPVTYHGIDLPTPLALISALSCFPFTLGQLLELVTRPSSPCFIHD